jgi:hypothetical protein
MKMGQYERHENGKQEIEGKMYDSETTKKKNIQFPRSG